MSMRAVFAVIISLEALSACARGRGAAPPAPQNDTSLRTRVAEILAQAGDRPLPRGDTLVTFAKQGAILYYTIANTPDSVASSMVRNDGLVGWTTSHWSGGRLTNFSARWANPDSLQVDIHGQITSDGVVLQGAKADRLTPPALPWAVADYGMDDQLVPLLMTLPHDTSQAIAIWRPFGQKWDTLVVRSRLLENVLLVSQGQETWAISSTGSLLLEVDRAQASQRRPLKGNARFAEYQRMLAIVQHSP